MPDIMMCDATNCEKAVTCYRNVASGTEPDPYMQTYWLRDESSPSGDICENYWKVTPAVKAAHDGTF